MDKYYHILPCPMCGSESEINSTGTDADFFYLNDRVCDMLVKMWNDVGVKTISDIDTK